MSKESGGSPGGGGNHNGGVNGGGANSGSSKGGGNGGGKGSGKNDSRGSSGPTSLGGASSYGMGEGSFNNSIGANNKGQQATSGGGRNDSNSVTSRIPSISKTLSTYKATPTPKAPRQQLAGPAPNADMSEADQRAAYSAGAAVARDHGVLSNLMSRVNQGIATKDERSKLDRIESAATRHSTATVVGGTALGKPGSYIGNGLASLFDGDDYDSQLGKRIGTGEMKGVLGSINDKFGQGSIADTALGVAANAASAVVPGASLVFNAISNGLRAPNASAIAEMRKALGKPVGVSGTPSNGSSRDYGAPPRPGVAPSTEQARDEGYQAFRYDPTQYLFNQGQRATEEWRY